MNKAGLLELIANGENSGVAFQSDDVRPEELARDVVAFANAYGGQILLGVDAAGTIPGVQRNDLETRVMDTVFDRYVRPSITPFYDEIRIDEGRIVALVAVSQGVAKPYAVRSRSRDDVYVRIGSTSRPATNEQQAHLDSLGSALRTELLPVSGSGLADLSRGSLKHYLSSIVQDTVPPASDEEWHTRLCGLGFMTEREDAPAVCTIAGLILFGHSPRRFLRQAGVRWIAFKGKRKADGALDDRQVDGPLVALGNAVDGVLRNGLIEDLFLAMRPFVSEESAGSSSSQRRRRKWVYPVEALREVIVNAMAHRDWTRSEQIEVARFEDRIEVQSPGAMHGAMTVEKMLAGQRSPRNPLIADVLRNYGYVDERGMGVRNKIVPLLQSQNGAKPEFTATKDYLRLVMPRGSVRCVSD